MNELNIWLFRNCTDLKVVIVFFFLKYMALYLLAQGVGTGWLRLPICHFLTSQTNLCVSDLFKNLDCTVFLCDFYRFLLISFLLFKIILKTLPSCFSTPSLPTPPSTPASRELSVSDITEMTEKLKSYATWCV